MHTHAPPCPLPPPPHPLPTHRETYFKPLPPPAPPTPAITHFNPPITHTHTHTHTHTLTSKVSVSFCCTEVSYMITSTVWNCFVRACRATICSCERPVPPAHRVCRERTAISLRYGWRTALALGSASAVMQQQLPEWSHLCALEDSAIRGMRERSEGRSQGH